MSIITKIQWCHCSWSPWFGCSKVSEGCANCYIVFTTPFRVRGLKHGQPRQRASKGYWQQPKRWDRAAAAKGERWRIFPSLCDWLDGEVPIEWTADFMKLVRETSNLDWLLLTKRPENFFTRMAAVQDWHFDFGCRNTAGWIADWIKHSIAPKNVWLGTSTENQKRADERIPELLKIPSQIRFLSIEPLLDEIDISSALGHNVGCGDSPAKPECVECGWLARPVDWVIVGGESGAKARPCNVDWIRDIVKQCETANVPAFVKQLGTAPYTVPTTDDKLEVREPLELIEKKGGDIDEWPADLKVRKFPCH